MGTLHTCSGEIKEMLECDLIYRKAHFSNYCKRQEEPTVLLAPGYY